jgi:type III restriction enzyme
MVETKASKDMEAADVLSKQAAAVKWCGHATNHAHGKPWQYLMIPHDVVADNMTLAGLAGVV